MPGGAVWGSNAVNGVVNIITKKATDSQRGEFNISSGNAEDMTSLSYGGKLDDTLFYRISGQFLNRAPGQISSTVNGVDDALGRRFEARLDWQASPIDELSFFAETFSGHNDRNLIIIDDINFTAFPVQSRTNSSSSHLMVHWSHQYDSGAMGDFRAYYDESERKDRQEANLKHKTIDFEYHHQANLSNGHMLSWGGGYRTNTIQTQTTNSYIDFDFGLAHDDTESIVSAHIQDEFSIDNEGKSFITLGSKFEYAEFTQEVKIQPTLRFRHNWQQSVFWAGISRAHRKASVGERGIRVKIFASPVGGPANLPVVGELQGSDSITSGDITAYEMGLRFEPHESLLVDFTAFYNKYDDLIGLQQSRVEPVGFPQIEYFRIVHEYSNGLSATTIGFEATADWKINADWQLKFAYTNLDIDLSFAPGEDMVQLEQEKETAENQLSIRSVYQLSPSTTFDLWLRYVGKLESINVDDYVALNLRFNWQVNDQLELSLIGQNLTDKSHYEFNLARENTIPTQVRRAISINAKWQF